MSRTILLKKQGKMSRARKVLRNSIALRKDKISKLENEIEELTKAELMISDKFCWIKEVTLTQGKGKSKQDVTFTVIVWNEEFKDEDTGEVITIERFRAIKRDGIWI